MFYPFEQTRKWSITGFKIILNSSVIMLCLVVMVVMAILALENILVTGRAQGFDFALASAYEDFGVVPMALIFTAFLVIKVSGLAVSLADRIIHEGGGDTRFQKKVAALVGTIGQFIIGGTLGAAGKAINKAIDRIAERSDKIQLMRNKMSQIQYNFRKLAGRVPPSSTEEEQK